MQIKIVLTFFKIQQKLSDSMEMLNDKSHKTISIYHSFGFYFQKIHMKVRQKLSFAKKYPLVSPDQTTSESMFFHKNNERFSVSM